MVLEIKNLSVEFVGGFALKNVNLSVGAGQKVALVGESGSGKSLLAKQILSLNSLCGVGAKIIGGEINFCGKNIAAISEFELRILRGNAIAYIPQEPLSALNPLHKVGKQIAEALILHSARISKAEVEKRVSEAVKIVGLDSALLNRFPHELSGGERQRVLIATAIINRPKLLILDEPTTALDALNQKKIIDMLASFDEVAMLLISHDLGVVKGFASKTYVAKNGEIIESGATKQILSRPKMDYTKMLVDALDLPKVERLDYERNLESPTAPVLALKNYSVYVKKGVFGKRAEILKPLNLELKKGEILGIAGGSGSGKSTLAQSIFGFYKSCGELRLNNILVRKDCALRAAFPHRDISMVFQDPFGALNPRMRVKDIILEGAKFYKIKADLGEILSKVALSPALKNRYPHELSGGERQRVALGRAIATNPKILILDEPTSALDKSAQKVVLSLICALHAQFSTIFITHDLDILQSMSHRLIILRDGEIIESGNTFELFANPQSEYFKELLCARF